MQINLSVKYVEGLSKKERLWITQFTNYYQMQFSELQNFLAIDICYSAFNYLGYIRKTENICGSANIVIIDIDYTSIPIEDCLEYLVAEDLICMLSTTSDTSNTYKYRVILPLDREVTAQEYRQLVYGIKQYGLLPDMDVGASCKPAGIFYAYAGSAVLSSFTGQPLCVDDYLVDISTPTYGNISPPTDIVELLPDFESYRYAIKGKRTRSLISAGYKCHMLGMTDEQVEQTIMYINSLFLIPKSPNEVHRRVLNFIKTRRSL